MEAKPKTKGSWGVRFFIAVLGAVLGILFFWLLSFVENDIGRIEGLKWEDVRREFVSEAADQQGKLWRDEAESLERTIKANTEQMSFLSRSISAQQNTINQLLELQKDSTENRTGFSDENQQILLQSQQMFVENQKKYEAYNQEIAELTRQLRGKEDQLSALDSAIREQETKALKKHNVKNAAFKLAFLLPVLLVIAYVFMKHRTGCYWPLAWAAFIASFVKVVMVVHAHFPTLYFKYIALLVIIVIVLWLLVYLIRMIISPKNSLLIKQYQQHYDKCICPVCSKPIRTGLLRYAGCLKKKSIVLASLEGKAAEQEPYTCPSCGTGLYDKCDGCGKIRHSLLPHCEHCGQKKESTPAINS